MERIAALALLLSLCAPATAQQQPHVLVGDEANEALTAHNSARARFGIPPLEWDATLAEIALRCVHENTGRSFRHCDTPHGENMYASTLPAGSAAAVAAWMTEEVDYDVARRRCRDFACGHFTQVVWYATERVGCAVGPGERGWNNLICNYDPPGNYGYMGNDAGERVASGDWFYFDPPPFGTTSPTLPAAAEPAPASPPPSGAPATASGAAGTIEWEAPWSLDDETYRSGLIGHGSASFLRATLTGPGTLTFRWRTSSEEGFDTLVLEVDGQRALGPVSGESAWISASVILPAGDHDLAWIYRKDADTSAGEDAAWVDQVRFERREP